MTTEELDASDGDPNADMSISTDLYEVAGGASIRYVDIYAGFGVGPQRVHQRTASSASEPDDIGIAERGFLGVSVDVKSIGPARVRGFAAIGGALTGYLAPDDGFEDGRSGPRTMGSRATATIRTVLGTGQSFQVG